MLGGGWCGEGSLVLGVSLGFEEVFDDLSNAWEVDDEEGSNDARDEGSRTGDAGWCTGVSV